MKGPAKILSLIFVLGLIFIPFSGFAQGGDSFGSISGYVRDKEGRIIKNIPLYVFAYRSGEYVEGNFSSESGRFSIGGLKSGDWFVSADTDSRSGYTASGFNVPVNLVPGSPASTDITLERIGGVISGLVTAPDGRFIDKALVNVVNTGSTKSFFVSQETDPNGLVRFLVPAGKFLVQAFFSPTLGVLNPEARELDIENGELASLSLIFRKFDRRVSGRVLKAGIPTEALVWAWSNKGGYVEMRAGADGFYELKLKADEEWYLKGVSSLGSISYESLESVLGTGSGDVEKDLELVRSDIFLPENKTHKFSGTTGGTFGLDNGMKLTFPPNIFPGKELALKIDSYLGPSQNSLSLVGPAYTIKLLDSQGAEIINLPKSVILEFPYSLTDLTKVRAKEDNLRITHWDKSSSAWRANGKSVVYKKDRKIIGLTRFLAAGVVADPEPEPPPPPPSGASPPSQPATSFGGGSTAPAPLIQIPIAPSLFSASAVSDTSSVLNWTYFIIQTNQTSVVQRSLDPAGAFTTIADNLSANSFTDTNLTANTTYYYRIIARSPNGESSPSQVFSATTLPAPSDTTPPQINNINIITSITNNETVISFTTNEPAKSNLEFQPVTGGVGGSVINPNFTVVHNLAIKNINLQGGTTYNLKLTVTDDNSNVQTSEGLSFTTPSFSQSQTAVQPPAEQRAQLSASNLRQAGILFSRNLTVGSRGSDVKDLQQFLNANGFRVSASGPGAPGLETFLFGSATRLALIRFQEAFAKQILLPAGLTRGTGFFGAGTRTFINQLRIR